MHLQRFAMARQERASGAVQPLHQLQEFRTDPHPDAVDRDELPVVGQRFDHAVRIVGVPGFVEARLDLPDGALVRAIVT